ncbi:hypothetical protein [Chromobacterium vaccinii]|uniref:hypothetical protein n=1 Tax=Chromobacterium vaccinii TaxID=1108595 RepID=UPI000A8408B5|nr:hypothetical protein [Chromobacterium vaccinii]
MINVKTFFKVGNEFFDAEVWEGNVDDINYIYGSICLIVDGCAVFDKELWDCVDQLWSYVVDGLYCLSKGQPFSFYFPDQAAFVSFNLTPKGDQVEIFIDLNGGRHVLVSKALFLQSMKKGGEGFFNIMRNKVPEYEDSWMECLKKLGQVSQTDI